MVDLSNMPLEGWVNLFWAFILIYIAANSSLFDWRK